MSQSAHRSFSLARFTYFRCCFQFVLSLSLAILALYPVSASDVLVLVPPTLPFFLTFSACFFFFMSSTWRELAAIAFALESFAPILEGSLVKWFTVSQTAARIIEVGSMELDLHRLAIKIFQFCAEHSIYLEVQWISRTKNEGADYMSRLVDFDDWQIAPDLFQSLEQLWPLIQLTVSLIIIHRSSLDSFRVFGIRVRLGSTSLPKS